MINPNFNELKIRLLEGNIDLNNFDCGNSDLNEFLKEDSLLQKRLMLNTTYLFFLGNDIIGFVTISSDALSIKKLGREYKKRFKDKNIIYKDIPSIKLGRLAVDKEFQNSGVGDFLIRWLFYYSVNKADELGFRFINIDAYIPSYKFYEKYHFKPISTDLTKDFKKYERTKNRDREKANKMTIPMFFDLYKLKLIGKYQKI
ncbi:MAG: GNAT family N-acetyltransferase [Methanobrevibacter sp.]|nr:GNAT family N-acetyltransferase [Methanobrevibacter sp.]